MPISDAERAERRNRIDASRHDAYLDGHCITPATERNQEDYVAGLIDLDEIGRRIRARYGISSA